MTRKASALAPSNIAFIKYWGKRNPRLNTPFGGSISMNLSEYQTTTTVQFTQLNRDEVVIDGEVAVGKEEVRVARHIDRIRSLAGVRLGAQVESRNNFPVGVGIASSASGFAALTLAATRASGLRLSQKRLSALARLGSGSACRSIPDGFVEWVTGRRDQESYAFSIHPPDYWDIRDVVVLVSTKKKSVGSSEGHALARTSPFFRARIRSLDDRLRRLKRALRERDFSAFGRLVEEEALNMHAVMLTSTPPLVYWEPGTLAVMKQVGVWRARGMESYFTLDAGPTVHVMCRAGDAEVLARRLRRIPGVIEVSVNRPAVGARVVKEDLF